VRLAENFGASRICASAWAQVYKPIIVSCLPRLGHAPFAAVAKRLIRQRYVRFRGPPDMADCPPRLVYDANDPQQTIQLGGELLENSIEPIIYTGADVRWKC